MASETEPATGLAPVANSQGGEAAGGATPMHEAIDFLILGGPAIWAIAALSVIATAMILWKIWRLALIGAWSKGKARHALAAMGAGDAEIGRAHV